MGLESFKDAMIQVKSVIETAKNFSESVTDMLGLQVEEQKKEEQQTIDHTKHDIVNLQQQVDKKEQSPEYKKMIAALSEYCRLLLSPSELQSIGNIFIGDTLEEQLHEYVKEQHYIQSEKKKNNSIPQQSLQKAYDIYDPTTNIQTLFDEVANQLAGSTSKQQYEYVTSYLNTTIARKEQVVLRQQEFRSHSSTTRLQTKPNPDLVRYHDEEKALKTTGFAYDINNEKDPQMKTPANILKRFVSSGVAKSEKGTTLCARTTFLDAQRLFHLKLPLHDAFTVMRQEQGNFSRSIVSDLYNKKEKAKTKVDSIHPNWNMGNNDYINKLAPQETNVADLFVTSNTPKGKLYGHRALMFRVSNQRYVLDPYTAVQPGEDKNKPRTLESYAKSMKTGKNKREFMRMNFYKAPVNLETKAVT
ncbi:hypothetical protein XF24_00755 [candidate division SR1 bacterium Aalborg_AAW-1]|nr:hypothetical protein XF24_00755 [candidate division SR1 bacterium Aalborg_AAW-1]